MKQEQMLLVILMEECDELSQRASKAIRFGLDEIQSGQELNNAQRIIYEFNDIVATMNLVFENITNDSVIDHNMVALKSDKIKKWLEHSKSQGQLSA